MATTTDKRAAALEEYLSASDSALEAEQRIRDGWQQYFERGADPPSEEWTAVVAERRQASELSLRRALTAAAMMRPDPPLVDPDGHSHHQTQARIKRRRRKESPVLRAIGRRGQRVLRAVILAATLASSLVATAGGISLALEVAGLLRLVDDPVRLPIGVQLASSS